HYRQALEEMPDDPKALVSLGLALYELGLYDQSLQYYAQAVEVSPEDPLGFEKTSQLFELLGQNEQVITPALRASELYHKEGNIAKAVECLVRVNRADAENLPAHSRLALIYERTDRKQQAVTEFLIVASLMQHQGELENAKQAAEHALSIQPTSREAAEALSLIENGVSLPKPIPSREETFRVERESIPLSEPVTSREDEVSDLDPVAEAHKKALLALANLVFEQEAGDRKNDQVEFAREMQGIADGTPSVGFIRQGDPQIVFTHLQRAVINRGKVSEQEAAEELEKAVEAGLDHPAAYFDLGFIHSRGDRLESAVRYLERSLGAADYALAARIILARTMRFMGRLNEAATNYLEALRLADAQVVPKDQSADILRMYDPILEAESKQSDPQIKNKLCDLIEDMLFRPGWQQHLAQARGDYQIDIDGAPSIPVGEVLTNPQGYRIVESVRTINQYARSGHMRSAMEEAYFAIQFAPTYLPLHTYMGELLLKQEHLKEAIEKFGAIAQTYRARGETLHAIKVLQRLLKAAPMDLNARMQLIALQEEKGQYNEAIQEKVNLAGVYYNLADLNRAREAYLDAYQLAQNTGTNRELTVNILHHLADIELQSLDWKHAVEIYEQIRSVKPDDYQATEKLIELKLRLGQDQQAQIEVNDYLSFMEISGEDELVLTYLEKLVDEYPERIFIRRKKAELHLKDGQIEAAIQEYDAIGELLLDVGDREGAKQAIRAILDLDPPDKVEYQELINKLDGEE
ncbi:MAG: tetratricopeptide repeat protein, partial [Chloroflexi bacterium]|nr:tetratricopeptide repeat protein [Chloroflexota bacterium]